jgi:hypothetical protein
MKEIEKLYKKIKELYSDAELIEPDYNNSEGTFFNPFIRFNNETCDVIFTKNGDEVEYALKIFNKHIEHIENVKHLNSNIDFYCGGDYYYDSTILLKKIEFMNKENNRVIIDNYNIFLKELEKID